ncbi:MAG TPA: S4 domain-containing protein YaaA [Acholeplasma sp.]|nr:S4 domain-containing protein YaaA [Acholeplasma sp.]
MENFKLKTEYITLGQFLKATGIISSGGMVKPFLEDNDVFVNGELEIRRGKKLYASDRVKIDNKEFMMTND